MEQQKNMIYNFAEYFCRFRRNLQRSVDCRDSSNLLKFTNNSADSTEMRLCEVPLIFSEKLPRTSSKIHQLIIILGDDPEFRATVAATMTSELSARRTASSAMAWRSTTLGVSSTSRSELKVISYVCPNSIYLTV